MSNVETCFLHFFVTCQRLLSILQRKEKNHQCEGKSLREIWKELKKFSIGYLKIGEELDYQVGKSTEIQPKILTFLGLKVDKERYSQVI